MIFTAKTSANSLISSMESSLTTAKTNLTSKSTSELYKSGSKDNYKSEDFNKILNSKVSENKKTVDTNSSQVSNDNNDSLDTVKDKIDNLNNKLKELEEDSKSDSTDKVEEVLAELLKLLAGLGINTKDLQQNGKVANSELLKTMLDGQGSNNNLNSLMENIMQLLKDDSVNKSLDTSSLKLMNNILNNLNNSLGDDKKETKNNIKNLMSEISNMLDNKQNQGDKLTVEDMLNKNYSQNNSDSSAQDENSNESTSKDKEVSKEDKFLKSLIDDKKDDSLNKINLFASRVGTVQNQGTNVVRGLTINKATFTDDFIRDVKFMSNNSLKELTVKVNPGNLGEITIKLVQEDGLMKANLKANSKETVALLSQNLADIKKQLNDQNIKISDVNIELYQDDTTFFKEQGFQGQLAGEQNRNNNNSQNNISNVESITSESLEENLAEENNNISYFA